MLRTAQEYFDTIKEILDFNKREAVLVQNSRALMIDIYSRWRKRKELDDDDLLPESIERIYHPERLDAIIRLGLLEKTELGKYILTSKGKELAEAFIATSSEMFMGNHQEYKELFEEFRPDRYSH